MGFEMWILTSLLPRFKPKAPHQDREERQGCLSQVLAVIWGGEKRQFDESYYQHASQQFHQDVPVSKPPGLVDQLRYDPKVETRLSSCKPGQGPPLLSTESESASSRGPKAAPTSTSSEGAKDCHSQEPPVNAVPRNARPGNQRPESQDSILSLNRYLNKPELYEDIIDEACGTNLGSAIDESTTSFTPCPPTPQRADVPRNGPAGTRSRGSTGSSAPQISEFEIQSGSSTRESGVFGCNSNPLLHRDARLGSSDLSPLAMPQKTDNVELQPYLDSLNYLSKIQT
ncbi:hypothetical protein ASPCAL06939 [Aspergillus calidoustus]|uniref:Uncharacterized protein n=1 Tax=Aspergillus calidoustus TaxID=454130 RepID=A0A0U5G1H0_ASPCI|nr:hypothetical protein ASPCAL06939 [Aspergillus calidoustus]